MPYLHPCLGCWTFCPSCDPSEEFDPPEFEDMEPAGEERIDELDEEKPHG